MQRRRFGREFKVEAVRLIRDRGVCERHLLASNLLALPQGQQHDQQICWLQAHENGRLRTHLDA